MKSLFSFIFLFTTINLWAQSNLLTKTINEIEFQKDTVLSVYDWITDNIKYDVTKLSKMKKGANFYKKGNFKSRKEYETHLIKEVIRKKKGVCQDYTLLFDAIMKELGYTSVIVNGATKDVHGRITHGEGHTWMAVKIDGTWKLYDPTWGAGSVNDKGKFVKKYNAQWYDRAPSEMIKTHFPADPMWQLSTHPMTYSEFKTGRQEAASEKYNYEQIIETHLTSSGVEQLTSELARIKSTKGNHKAINKRIRSLKKKIEAYGNSDKVDLLNSAVEDCKQATDQFNAYLKAKSNRFKNDDYNLEHANESLLEIKIKLNRAIEVFGNTKMKGKDSRRKSKKSITQTKKMLRAVEDEIEFVENEMKH